MTHITKIIIFASIFFSSTSLVFSNDFGTLGNLLDLQYGPEELELRLSQIDTIYLDDYNMRELLKETIETDQVLQEEIIRLYRSNELDFNIMTALISAHKKFVFYTNDMFQFLRVQEIYGNSKQTSSTILESYKNTRVYYKKMQNLLQEQYDRIQEEYEYKQWNQNRNYNYKNSYYNNYGYYDVYHKDYYERNDYDYYHGYR